LNTNQFLIYTAAWLGIISAIWNLFGYIAEVSSAEFNKKVTLWIESIGARKIKSESKEVIYGMFTRFFGEKHFSKKCLIRSCAYSTTIFALILLISILFAEDDIPINSFDGFLLYILLLLPILLVMILQDFLSLYKTRVLLNIVMKSKRESLSGLIFIDVFTTFLLSVFISLLFQYLKYAVWGDDFFGGPNPFHNFSKTFFDHFYETSLQLSGSGRIFITIYLGTFWILIVQLAGAFTKLSSKTLGYFKIVKSAIDIKEKPIKSLGVITIIWVTMAYLISLPVFFILHK
jgi:hypothetical protein